MHKQTIQQEIVPQRLEPPNLEDTDNIVAQAVVESVLGNLESRFGEDDTGVAMLHLPGKPASQASVCPHLRALKDCIRHPEQLLADFPAAALAGPDLGDGPCGPAFAAEVQARLEQALMHPAGEERA